MCARSKLDEASSSTTDEKRLMQQSIRKQKRQAMQQHLVDKTIVALGPKEDLIAVATAHYYMLVVLLGKLVADFQQSRPYKVLVGTTQPAHIVTLIAVMTVAMVVFPRGQLGQGIRDTPRESSIMSLIYLAAFTTHYGAQMWMTFISGLTLYFALPRHTFGAVQQALFPKYFGLNSFLSLVTLIVFVKLHPANSWDSQIAIQVCALILCFLLELIIRLYLTPPLLDLMAAKNAIEKAADVGLEVGKHSVGSLRLCPHYRKLHKAFRTLHMSVAIGNMLAMGCTTLHLYYLSNKICLV